jgi:hypothetical protein
MRLGRLLYALSWAPVGLVVADFWAFPSRVAAADVSNADVLPPRSLVVVSRLGSNCVPERGDLVSMTSPVERVTIYRRVVALDGDYLRPRGQDESDPRLRVVPPGAMWVEATTPVDAETTPDSNDFGPVSTGLVHGRVRYATGTGAVVVVPAPSGRIIVATARYRPAAQARERR